jgi:hypothetical protein
MKVMHVIDLCGLVKSLITSSHGWAVADQFEDTFNGESFEKQNGNALVYIRGNVRGIIKSDLLNDSAQEDLQDYLDELEDFLAKPSE